LPMMPCLWWIIWPKTGKVFKLKLSILTLPMTL
jgi:hypothetical protein